MSEPRVAGRPYARTIVLEAVGTHEATGFVVSTQSPGGLAFEGHWELDYACSSCHRALCKGVKRGLFAGIVFRCGACGALNRAPELQPRLSAFE